MSAEQIAVLGLLVAAVLTTGVTLLVRWIRWSIATAVRTTVNGGIDRVQHTVDQVAEQLDGVSAGQDRLDRRLDRHERRQDIAPPDGWTDPEASTG